MDKERKVWVSAQVDTLLRYRLGLFASDNNITRSELIRRACEQYLGVQEIDEVLDNHAAWLRNSSDHIN